MNLTSFAVCSIGLTDQFDLCVLVRYLIDALHIVRRQQIYLFSSGDAIGLSLAEKAFFDILKAVAVKYEFIENFPDEKLTELAKAIKTMVEEQSDVEDWLNRTDLRATLKMNVIVLLARAGYPPKIRDEVYKEILEQAENFKRHSSPRPYSTFSDDSISIAAEP